MTRQLSCDDVDLLLAVHALGDVSAGEDRSLRRHLQSCDRCRAAGGEYLRTAAVLPLAADQAEPAGHLRSRILAAVHAEAAAEPPRRLRSRILATVHAEAAGPRRRGDLLRRLWLRVPTGRPLTAAAALVTAGAVALAAVALWRGDGSAPSPSPSAVVVRQGCGSLPGVPACATVRYDPAVRQATLTVTGLLPPAPVEGTAQVYEVWLVPRSGDPVAAAFLSRSPDGSSWTAAMNGDMSVYVAVAATQEPAGGSAVPARDKLFVVSLS